MNRMLLALACLATFAHQVGCAHREALPAPDGRQFAPGMYSFDRIEAPDRSPFQPAFAYPPLPDSIGGEVSLDGEPFDPHRHFDSPASDGPATAAAWLWFAAYKATFSRADGNTCRFSPSCSTFALEAVRERGLFGVLLAFGRLHRNHAAERHYPMTTAPFLDDPVSNYTFSFIRPALDDFTRYDDPAHAWYQHLRAVERYQ